MKKSTQIENGSRVLFTQGATEVSLEAAIESFVRLELAGKSEKTKAWYRRRLGPFAEAVGAGRLLSDLMEIDLMEWYAAINSRTKRYAGSTSRPEIEGGLRPDTIHGYVRAVKRFFKWLEKKGVLTVNLAADLELPRLPKGGRKGIRDDHARMILDAAQDNPRDYALLLFIEASGCRRGGAAGLLLSDLCLDEKDDRLRRRATVREKGGDCRPVFLTPEAVDALVGWLLERRELVTGGQISTDEEHVFLGQRPGGPWKPLMETGITEILRRYKKRLGITGRTSPHQWRHRWFRKLIKNKVGIKQASQMGGHKSVVVTDRYYSDLDVDELQELYDRGSTGLTPSDNQ